MIDHRRSSAHNLGSCEIKLEPEEIQAWTGFELVTSVISVQCSTKSSGSSSLYNCLSCVHNCDDQSYLHFVLRLCSRSPIFPWDRRYRCRSLSSKGPILVSWCERKWGEYKMPVGSGGGVQVSPLRYAINLAATTHGHFVLSPVRSHQETNMTARRTKRSTPTISRKNRSLWTVYIVLCILYFVNNQN